MTELVYLKNDEAVCSSLQVAEKFGKRHDRVLRAIDNLLETLPKNGEVSKMFILSKRKAADGQFHRMYFMNRDGFSLLVMGFTGKKALEWKLKYIKAFNQMEKFILERQTQAWIDSRKAGKLTRKAETDTIKKLVEYAQAQGSQHADKLYMTYSKLANKMAGVSKRGEATVAQLNNLSLMEHIILLTEGWDCPSVDCIVVLRPTKVRSLYCQMVGRGTRLSPETNKDHLLLLDFLWHTERHELCHPASLICESAEVAQKMTENMEKDAGCVIDIEEAEKTASEDVVAQREEALAKQLSEMKRRKKRLVDPLQFEMSIQAEDLSGYVPAFGWEMAPPSEGQKKTLEKLGILPDAIENAGKASKILDRLDKRRREGLTTPKQIRFLESRGFQHVGTWQFETAKNMIDRIAGNGWRVPSGIIPAEYRG